MAAVENANAMDTTTNEPTNSTDLTTEEVLLKLDELVNVASWLKRVAKPIIRRYGKKRSGKASTDGNAPTKRNGFAVPVVMAPQLISFLNTNCSANYDSTTELPRTEVTSLITAYIKGQALQTPENKKNFTVNGPLSKVFGVPEGTLSNWFDMQKHLTKVITSAKKRTADSAPPAAAPSTPADTPRDDSAAKPASSGKRIKRN